MKKPLEISMRSNGFRDLKQSLVLAVQEIRLLPLNCLVVHGFKIIRPSMAIQARLSGARHQRPTDGVGNGSVRSRSLDSFGMTNRPNCHSERSEESFSTLTISSNSN